MARSLAFTLLLIVPLLALSSSPKKSSKPASDRWNIQNTEYGQLRGSVKGIATARFFAKGDERKVEFGVAEGPDSGVYEVFLFRKDGQESKVGDFDWPSHPILVLTPDHVQFANLYSGYWDGFYIAKKADVFHAPPLPGSTGEETLGETTGEGSPVEIEPPPNAAPPTEIFDPDN